MRPDEVFKAARGGIQCGPRRYSKRPEEVFSAARGGIQSGPWRYSMRPAEVPARELHGVVLWHPHFIRRSTISGTSSTSSGRVTG